MFGCKGSPNKVFKWGVVHPALVECSTTFRRL